MDIRPFKGWRYRPADGDIGPFIAPPYDILSAADKSALLARQPNNIVAVDLPCVPPRQAGPPQAYQQAAGTLAGLMRQGVLNQDVSPALYLCEQRFTWAGRTLRRRNLLAGVRATALGVDVIPHEHTFAGPKADRLELTRATGMQLSPILGFFSAQAGLLDSLPAGRCCCDAHGELDGVEHRLWVVTDEPAIAAVRDALKKVPVYIADGHHRYTTAVTYRDSLLQSERIDPDHEANFVLFALIERQDPGLLVLPTHRMISGLSDDFSLEALAAATADQFQWQAVPYDRAGMPDADTFLKPFGRGAMAFIDAGGSVRLALPRRRAGDGVDGLDVTVLHRLIDGPLAAWRREPFEVSYSPRVDVVLDACRAGPSRLGVLLQGTPVEAVERIASTGGIMPHKSTYFYPKIATGLVVKPLR